MNNSWFNNIKAYHYFSTNKLFMNRANGQCLRPNWAITIKLLGLSCKGSINKIGNVSFLWSLDKVTFTVWKIMKFTNDRKRSGSGPQINLCRSAIGVELNWNQNGIGRSILITYSGKIGVFWLDRIGSLLFIVFLL